MLKKLSTMALLLVALATLPTVVSGHLASGRSFSPMSYGALGDGAHDDTAAWRALCRDLQAAGGGRIISPRGKNYLVYNANQPPTDLCTLTTLNGFVLQMNGSSFSVGHVFPAPQMITGAANNGLGLIRLTVGSTANMVDGDTAYISDVAGTAEANGHWPITVVDGTHIDLQRSAFANAYAGHGSVIDGQFLSLFFLSGSSHALVQDLAFKQVAPEPIPISSPQGTIGLRIDNGGTDFAVVNPVCRGGYSAVSVTGGGATSASAPRSRGVSIFGGSSIGCVYGTTFSNNGDDVTVRGFTTETVDRSYFAYGIKNHNIQIRTRNATANDVLIAAGKNGDGSNLPTENIRLDYRVSARTSTTPGSSYFTIDLRGGNPGLIRGIDAKITADLRGEVTAIPPVVLIGKFQTAALGATAENIRIRCSLVNIPNLPAGGGRGILDLFPAADAPWNTEYARNIMVEECKGTGSGTAVATHADLAALARGNGVLTWRNITLPGARKLDNASTGNTRDHAACFGGVCSGL